MAGLGHVRVASQQVGIIAGLHAMLGWCWGGVMVGHVHGNGVKVVVDLRVVKGEEGATTGLQVVRRRHPLLHILPMDRVHLWVSSHFRSKELIV